VGWISNKVSPRLYGIHGENWLETYPYLGVVNVFLEGVKNNYINCR
jgi:hypothetical protein